MNQFIFWLFLQHPSRMAFILFYLATGLLAGSIIVLILALVFLGSATAKMILLIVFVVSLLASLLQAMTRQSVD
jgi:protein-S-isoprenylcysteine O-methyltransferase Ste14